MKKTSLIFSVSLLVLAACSLDAPSQISENRVQVEHERFVEETPAVTFDQERVSSMAYHYERHGEGPLQLTVTYDPQSKSATAMQASSQASELVKAFRAAGVYDIDAKILPVKDSGASKVMVAYDGYNALAPEDCEMISGYEDRILDLKDDDYQLGCSVDTLLARQIARPKDLKGQPSDGATSDGRRGSNIVNIYRSGEPSAELNGETASETGG